MYIKDLEGAKIVFSMWFDLIIRETAQEMGLKISRFCQESDKG
jgi:hypothetical protein